MIRRRERRMLRGVLRFIASFRFVVGEGADTFRLLVVEYYTKLNYHVWFSRGVLSSYLPLNTR